MAHWTQHPQLQETEAEACPGPLSDCKWGSGLNSDTGKFTEPESLRALNLYKDPGRERGRH